MPSPASSSPTRIEPERALRMGVGVAAAPLWAAFFAAAGAGVTYWWMTSWSRRPTVEPKSFAAEPEEVMAHQPEPVAEPIEERVADIVTDTLAVAPEAVMEHAPVEGAPAHETLPAEIASADPVEKAIEAGKDSAEAKPRKKTVRKAKA